MYNRFKSYVVKSKNKPFLVSHNGCKIISIYRLAYDTQTLFSCFIVIDVTCQQTAYMIHNELNIYVQVFYWFNQHISITC